MQFIKHDRLRSFVQQTLQKVGLDDFSCDAVGEGLINASLRGIDSRSQRFIQR